MRYTAIGNHGRHFDLLDNGNVSLGQLQYRSWFTIKSDIQLSNGDAYSIDGANFFNTRTIVTKDGVTVAEITMDWVSNMIIEMADGRNFMLKHTNFWGRTLSLFLNDELLLNITRDFHFGNLSFNYFLDTNESSSQLVEPLVMLIALYCANRLFHTHTAGAV